MGGSCNCIKDTSNTEILFNNDINTLTSRTDFSDKLKNFNYASLDDPQYQKISKELFNILSDIRINPEKYIIESKEHSLLGIFIKIKPSTKISYSENNIVKIRKYIFDSYFLQKSFFEQEKELKNLINNGNIKDICLFQTIFSNNDLKENIWDFLVQNEDDIDKIFSPEYNYLMTICLPLEYNTKILSSLIFYKE